MRHFSTSLSVVLMTFFFYSTTFAAYEDQLIAQGSRKALDFEFECTVHTSVREKVYSPLIRLYKIKQAVETPALKDHMSQIFEREFTVITTEETLKVFQEFEKNAATPACNKHKLEFVKHVKSSPDITLWGHYYEYLGRKGWLQLLIYSESKKSILSYNINFR